MHSLYELHRKRHEALEALMAVNYRYESMVKELLLTKAPDELHTLLQEESIIFSLLTYGKYQGRIRDYYGLSRTRCVQLLAVLRDKWEGEVEVKLAGIRSGSNLEIACKMVKPGQVVD